MIALWLLLIGPALAAPDDPPRDAIVHGDDLAAWQALPAPDAPAADRVLALQAFLLDFPDSPLAPRAWIQLEAAGGPDAAWARAHRRLLEPIRTEARALVDSAGRVPIDVAVAPLDPDGQPETPPPPWTLRLAAGGGLEARPRAGGQPEGVIGLQLGKGALHGAARIRLGQAVNGELVARLAPPAWEQVWVEVGADTVPRGLARVGVALPIVPRLQLDTGAGVAVGADGLGVTLRLGLSLGGALRRAGPPDQSAPVNR